MWAAGAESPKSLTRGAAYLLAAWLAFGMAQIACLPPWEGFDETAHYSYLQQLVDTGRVPIRAEGFFSLDVRKYAAMAPMPAGQRYPLSYDAFFAQPSRRREMVAELVHRRPVQPAPFVPTEEWNWEVQQPPLHYIVMVPVYIATRHLSLAAHLFSLRAWSYGLAWLALVVAARTCARRLDPSGDRSIWWWGLAGASIWPLVFLTWFPQMARLGNDSLAALIGALLFARLVACDASGVSLADAIKMGLLLGAACLTKGLFLPVVPGIIGWLAIRAWMSRQTVSLRRQLAHVAIVCVVTALVASWWYLESLDTFQPLVIAQTSEGTITTRLANVTFVNALRGFAAYVTTVAWTGTWSLVRPRYVWLLPLSMMVLVTAAAYVNGIRRSLPTDVRWVPAWLMTPLILSLAVFVVLLRLVATDNLGNTAGRYLHFMVAPAAFGLGIGLESVWRHVIWRATFLVLMTYAALFGVAVSWAQLLFFSGLLRKSPDKFYELVGPLPAMLGVPEALSRLAVLAYPALGLAFAGLGALLAFAGLRSIWCAVHVSSPIEG